MRWDWLPNAAGTQHYLFWPPVAARVQAALLGLGGMTPFVLTAASSLSITVAAALAFGVARTLGFSLLLAAVGAVALFGPVGIERRMAMVRMENWQVVGALAATAALLWTIKRWRTPGAFKGGAVMGGALAGLGAAGAFLAYYPTGLITALGVVPAVWLAARAAPAPGLGRQLWWGFAMGAGVPALGFLAWVAPEWTRFRLQVLGSGGHGYWEFLPGSALGREMIHGFSLVAVQGWEVLGALLLGLVCFWRGTTALRILGCGALAAAGPLWFFPHVERLPGAGAFAVLALLGLWADCQHAAGRRLLGGAVLILAGLGMAKFSLSSLTAFLQREGRDYAWVETHLRAAVAGEGVVATVPAGWLALRELKGDGELLLVIPLRDQSAWLCAEPLLTEEGFKSVRYVVGSRSAWPAIRDLHPGLAAAQDHGYLVEKTRVEPPFRPLPWSRSPPYDLIVYENHVWTETKD